MISSAKRFKMDSYRKCLVMLDFLFEVRSYFLSDVCFLNTSRNVESQAQNFCQTNDRKSINLSQIPKVDKKLGVVKYQTLVLLAFQTHCIRSEIHESHNSTKLIRRWECSIVFLQPNGCCYSRWWFCWRLSVFWCLCFEDWLNLCIVLMIFILLFILIFLIFMIWIWILRFEW